MTYPRAISINEEGPREGFQAEPRFIATELKLALIDALGQTGLKRIVVTSFANPERVPSMRDAEELVARLERRPGVRYSAIWLNQRGLQRAVDTGRLDLEGTLGLTASEAFLQRNQRRTAKEDIAAARASAQAYEALYIPVTRLGIMAAFGCNYMGSISVEHVLQQVDTLVEIATERCLPVSRLTLADTMGWANPQAIKRLVGAVQDRHPQLAIALHLHDTRGLGIANAYAGLEMGIAEFDASIGGVGGCPFAGPNAAGNIATEALAFLCAEMGIDTGLDLAKLIDAAQLAERIFGRPLPCTLSRIGANALRLARTAQ